MMSLDFPYAFLLMFYSNLWPNSAPSQNIRPRNLSDLEFYLLRSLKVRCDSVIRLPISAFLSMFNSNIWPNSAPLHDIRLQNLSDLEFDLSRSNVMMSMDTWFPIDMYSNYMSNSHR